MAYIEFRFTNQRRFEMLSEVFDALRNAKRTNSFPGDEYWLGFFDEQACASFWWPTEQELQEWQRRWQATPAPQRFTDPTLQRPWTFGSMIDDFQNGEYELVACTQMSGSVGRLEFEPLTWPYGGTGCMRALVKAFGFEVLGESEV